MMQLTAPKYFKVAYIIVILAQIVPMSIMAYGLNAFEIGNGGLLMPYVGPIFIFVIGLYSPTSNSLSEDFIFPSKYLMVSLK